VWEGLWDRNTPVFGGMVPCQGIELGGTRTWVLRMQLNGQRRDYGLGSAYDVSLADARTAAAELRRRVQFATCLGQ
jgi:hypothetical protein